MTSATTRSVLAVEILAGLVEHTSGIAPAARDGRGPAAGPGPARSGAVARPTPIRRPRPARLGPGCAAGAADGVDQRSSAAAGSPRRDLGGDGGLGRARALRQPGDLGPPPVESTVARSCGRADSPTRPARLGATNPRSGREHGRLAGAAAPDAGRRCSPGATVRPTSSSARHVTTGVAHRQPVQADRAGATDRQPTRVLADADGASSMRSNAARRRDRPLLVGVVLRADRAQRSEQLRGQQQHDQRGGERHCPRVQAQPDVDGHDRDRQGRDQVQYQGGQERDLQRRHGLAAVPLGGLAQGALLPRALAVDGERGQPADQVQELAGHAREQQVLPLYAPLRRHPDQRHEDRHERQHDHEQQAALPVGDGDPGQHDDRHDAGRDQRGQRRVTYPSRASMPGPVALTRRPAGWRCAHPGRGATTARSVRSSQLRPHAYRGARRQPLLRRGQAGSDQADAGQQHQPGQQLAAVAWWAKTSTRIEAISPAWRHDEHAQPRPARRPSSRGGAQGRGRA